MTEVNGRAKVPTVLIGGGTIAPLHAEYLQSSPTCELIAIVDPFPPGKILAESLSVAHYPSVDELVKASGKQPPELYIVCVPSALHAKVATEVWNVASPKVMLVEKPFSTDSPSGEQLLALASSKGCKIAGGHHRRFHHSITAAKKTIISGKLGKLTAISGVWTCKKNDGYFTAAQWRGSRSGGGGPVWTNFVHDVDVMHYLVNSKIVRVWATGAVRRREHPNVEDGDAVEEGAALMFEFANGVVGTFLLSDNVSSPYGWESAAGDNPLYPRAETAVDSYRFFGTEGTLTVPDGNLWTYREEDAREKTLEVGWNIPMTRGVVEVIEAVPFQEQTEHLGRLVKGEEKQPMCSGEDGLAAVKVCEAIINALDKSDGFPVDIIPSARV